MLGPITSNAEIASSRPFLETALFPAGAKVENGFFQDDGTSPGTLEETAEPQLPRHSWRHELPGKGFLENGVLH